MLITLLNKIAEGKSLHAEQLSLELEVPREQIKAMLDHLVRDGYLKHYTNRSQSACTSPCGGSCQGIDSTTGDSITMWTVTQKGIQAIKG